jgi:hypothetical protein
MPTHTETACQTPRCRRGPAGWVDAVAACRVGVEAPVMEGIIAATLESLRA